MKTTIIYLRQVLAICAVMIAFVACGDDKDDVTGGDITVVTPAEKSIVCDGTDNKPVSITFTATGNWTARPSHGWMSLSKMSGGAGDQTIILVISDNDDYDKVRVGTVTITDKDSSKSVDITVTQGKKDGVLTFSSESQDGMDLTIFSDIADSDNNKIDAEVNVSSNYDYTISLDKDWLGYQPSVNEDGTTKINFKVTDYDKLYADGGYGEKICTVKFSYASETRAPGVVAYKVRFPGITPYVKFYTDYEEDAEAVSSVTLEEGDYEYTEDDAVKTKHTYLKMVYVKSNIAWQNVESDKLLVEYSGGNKSTSFFESQTSMNVILKDMMTEDLNEDISFKDIRNTGTSLVSLNVKSQGVGDDYVYIDWAAFQPIEQTTGCFMFEPEGEYPGASVSKSFTVMTANADNVAFYLAEMGVNFMTGLPSYVNAWDATSEDDNWGGVEWEETRAIVKSKTATIWLNARGAYGRNDNTPEKNCFVALFAVSKTQYPTFDDLFDEDELKPELEEKYIILGQKGKVENLTLETEDVEEGGTVKVSSDGEKIIINYTTNAPMGVTTFIQNVKGSIEDPYKWTGDDEVDSSIFKLKYPEDGGSIEITVSENKTGKKREIWCGLATYVENPPVADKDCLLYTFKIEQESK